MSSETRVRIRCDLKKRGCANFTALAEGTIGDARKAAAARGWEVMRGNHGRDVCPPCRIVEIKEQTAEPQALPDDIRIGRIDDDDDPDKTGWPGR